MENGTPGLRVPSLPLVASPVDYERKYPHSIPDTFGLLSPSLISPDSHKRWHKAVEPPKLDLHILKVSANPVGSRPYHTPGHTPMSSGFGLTPKSAGFDFTPKSAGFGHDRSMTDPFVEQPGKSAQPSPFLAQVTGSSPAPMDMTPGSAASLVPASPFFQRGQSYASSPGFQGGARSSPLGARGTPRFQLFERQSTTPATLSFPPRQDLPIPPPPLSSTNGQLFHTPEARARLDAQTAVRADWIRNEAKMVADLSRASFTAARRFEETQTQSDYEEWKRLAQAYDVATDLEKRQEERRNLFMPHGMKAMRTGGEIASDVQSAAFPPANDVGPGEGHLLGFQAAYWERIYAEVKRGNDEKEKKAAAEDEITVEMLDTLSKEEKLQLRQHLVRRLLAAADSESLAD
jgi:hypothetical protein